MWVWYLLFCPEESVVHKYMDHQMKSRITHVRTFNVTCKSKDMQRVVFVQWLAWPNPNTNMQHKSIFLHVGGTCILPTPDIALIAITERMVGGIDPIVPRWHAFCPVTYEWSQKYEHYRRHDETCRQETLTLARHIHSKRSTLQSQVCLMLHFLLLLRAVETQHKSQNVIWAER